VIYYYGNYLLFRFFLRQERTDSGLSNDAVSVTAVVLGSVARGDDKDDK
jgi:hypothetical protein